MAGGFRNLVSMELDDEDKIDACMPIPCNQPDFPWGLRISLTQKEMDKLGLDPADAVVGGLCHGHFMARVTSSSMNRTDRGDDCRIELQIEDLEIESEDAEDAQEEAAEGLSASRRRRLYGGA